MSNALTKARDLLATPTAQHWTDLQRLLAENHGEPDYEVLRAYALEHLRGWPAKLLITDSQHEHCGDRFPNDPLFYIETLTHHLPEDSHQRKVLEDAGRVLRSGEADLFHIFLPEPMEDISVMIAHERFEQDIPADVRAFFEVSDGFCLCMMRKDNEGYEALHAKYKGGFGLAPHDFDWYAPDFDAYFNYLSLVEVFQEGSEADELDQHGEYNTIHTRLFSHQQTNGHFFCLYPADKLTEGRTSYDASWSIGVANDHWIAFDDWIHLPLAEFLEHRRRACELFNPDDPPTVRNVFSMISFAESFNHLRAEDWDAFPFSKEHTITAEDAEVVAAWFEARRPAEGWYSRPRLNQRFR